MRPCWVRGYMNFKSVKDSEKGAQKYLPLKNFRKLTKWNLPALPSLPEQKKDSPTKVIRLVLGNWQSYFFERKFCGETYKLFYKIVHRKVCVKILYFKAPSLGNLFHLNKCVKKNVHVPFFARNACLPYRKNGFKADFLKFAHFFRYGLFY